MDKKFHDGEVKKGTKVFDQVINDDKKSTGRLAKELLPKERQLMILLVFLLHF